MNYGQIKEAVTLYSNRTDITPAIYTIFLGQAEQRIYNGSTLPGAKTSGLKIAPMVTIVNPATTTLPENLREIKRISAIVGAYKKPLDFVPYESIGTLENTAGIPNYYSISGSQIIYSPTFSNNVELVYYAKFVTPTIDTDTNWITDNAPAVYIAAMLLEVAIYTRDDAMFQQQAALFVDAINSLQSDDDNTVHSGSNLRIRSDNRRVL
jgi:hypothetical protein